MREVFGVFLRLGATGFGGPIALIAMIEEEVSRRRRWLTQQEFAEIYSVCKLLPGPVAIQIAIYVGVRRAGRWGGLLAGIGFALPAFLMILALSVSYAQLDTRSAHLRDAFTALQSAALALVCVSTWQLAKPHVRHLRASAVMLASAIWVYLLPTWEPLAILAFGLVGAILALREARVARAAGTRLNSFAALLLPVVGLGALKLGVLSELFWVCFKSGEFVFGTGLAFLPLLEGEFVQRLRWLTHAEFLDGIAVGQVTPGPITMCVVFFGYKVAGLAGGLAAMVGLYLPSFFNVLVVLPWLWDRIRGTPALRGFAAWAFPAVVGGIACATMKLGASTLHSPLAGLAFALTLAGVIFSRVPGWVFIPLAGALGILRSFLPG
jgi:chromate transporter